MFSDDRTLGPKPMVIRVRHSDLLMQVTLEYSRARYRGVSRYRGVVAAALHELWRGRVDVGYGRQPLVVRMCQSNPCQESIY